MEWLAKLFTKYPEMAVYLAVGIGYLIGRFKFRGVGLGVVTGSLLGGILIGNFFHVPVSDQAKSILFLLFLFGIGYSVGPSFFQSLKGDGWRWAVLGIFVPVVGLAAGYTVAHVMKLSWVLRRIALGVPNRIAHNRDGQRSNTRFICVGRAEDVVDRAYRRRRCDLLYLRHLGSDLVLRQYRPKTSWH